MLTDDQKSKLIKRALQARQRAYAPYSGYAVGAALFTKTGEIYTGVNVENAAYPTSICAERVAVFKAISEGDKEFEAMVVASTVCLPCEMRRIFHRGVCLWQTPVLRIALFKSCRQYAFQ